jgi:hypothetical protein
MIARSPALRLAGALALYAALAFLAALTACHPVYVKAEDARSFAQ